MKLTPSELTALEALMSERHHDIGCGEVDRWLLEEMPWEDAHLGALLRALASVLVQSPAVTLASAVTIGFTIGRNLEAKLAESRQLEGMLK